MATAVMPNFWPDAASALFAILETQFRPHRINNLEQWLPEEVAISVSDVLLEPLSDAPYTDLKMVILHQTSRTKHPTSTKQT